jgi:hypothetical protein
MEIGSYIELDLRSTGEYYDTDDTIRLNAARGGIYHACKLYGVSGLYLPYYICPSLTKFLQMHGIRILYYHIDKNFEPQLSENATDTAVLVVNYFGILSAGTLKRMAGRYTNVIVDNSQAFYSLPVEGCLNVYSPRKFFGVPDGCYLTGKAKYEVPVIYPRDNSSDTSGFLLKRIEKGCSAAYTDRMENEERIDNSDIMQMSVLTRTLLAGIDYQGIKNRRRANFYLAHQIYESINLIDAAKYSDAECVPMVYPLVVRKTDMTDRLARANIYTGRWWKHVLSEVNKDSFEAFMSEFMIPLPIDQRYSEQEIRYVSDKIFAWM